MLGVGYGSKTKNKQGFEFKKNLRGNPLNLILNVFKKNTYFKIP